MSNNNDNDNDGKNRPIERVRLGVIQAAIWKNETDKGTMFNVTFERSFRDKNTEEWRNTSSFGRDDLPVVEKVAARAYARIHALQGADRKAARETEENDRMPEGGEPEVMDGGEHDPAPARVDAGKATRAKPKGRGAR